MSDIYQVKEKMHKMRAKLYPSYLPGTEGGYIARTSNEASVTIEDICASMKNRGGYDGSYEEAVKTLRHFLKEMMYQLADGFSASLDYFTVHPNIGGVFKTAAETCDRKKHPITFRFSTLAKLRDLAMNIEVEVEGIAETSSYIDQFVDLEEDMTNSLIVAGHGFSVHGHNIKIEGDDPCGMYFVPVDDPAQKVQVERILENTPSKITAIAPYINNSVFRVEIVTQSAQGKTLLKTPRTIISPFTIEDL